MKDRVVLITKDAMCKDYLPIYGGCYCATPNIDELASKGTVFNRFYTVAPSTAMSAIGMFTEVYPYQTENKKYVAVNKSQNSVYDQLFQQGYECHIIWDECDVKLTKTFSECYGDNTIYHILHVDQVVGSHNLYGAELHEDNETAQKSLDEIFSKIDEVFVNNPQRVFLWIHVPQVLIGRTCYGSDMDLFDTIVGYLRKSFDDDGIYISSDHGNMNGQKDKIAYGFDVYESAINIPLITPRLNNMDSCDIPISNKNIMRIIMGDVPTEEYVVSDTAYYAQPNRKTAIIKGRYKYIYNKKTKAEEFYDVIFDPNENCNIVDIKKMDIDRKVQTLLTQVYYYPYWNESRVVLDECRTFLKSIWRTENVFQKIFYGVISKLRKYKAIVNQKVFKK